VRGRELPYEPGWDVYSQTSPATGPAAQPGYPKHLEADWHVRFQNLPPRDSINLRPFILSELMGKSG
jgi:hypothetical protein